MNIELKFESVDTKPIIKGEFKMKDSRRNYLIIALTALAILISVSKADAESSKKWAGTKVNEPAPKAKGIPKVLSDRLAKFDDLDFRVYTNQEWQDLHKSHSKDVKVHWPDGHITVGIEKHIEDLKFMFTFAPDNRIEEHPIRFGTQDGEWTAVTGWLKGTFSKPMQVSKDKSIPATQKTYNIPMATIGHWNKEGIMDEEWLFWDNGEFNKQIGLGQ